MIRYIATLWPSIAGSVSYTGCGKTAEEAIDTAVRKAPNKSFAGAVTYRPADGVVFTRYAIRGRHAVNPTELGKKLGQDGYWWAGRCGWTLDKKDRVKFASKHEAIQHSGLSIYINWDDAHIIPVTTRYYKKVCKTCGK